MDWVVSRETKLGGGGGALKEKGLNQGFRGRLEVRVFWGYLGGTSVTPHSGRVSALQPRVLDDPQPEALRV